MARLLLTLAYDGTQYHGWQRQAWVNRPEPPTIQAVLEKQISRVLGKYTPVLSSGRTDAGVHAEAQACHFDIPDYALKTNWVSTLNAMLPSDIRIISARQVPQTFHARRDAVQKQYSYSLWSGHHKALPRLAPYVWSTQPLNLEAMQEAANHLVGTHDFASLQNKGTPQVTTVRTIYSIQVTHGEVGGMHCPKDWPVSTWHIVGNAFLKQMVRNMIGLLVWVGIGKLAPAAVAEILAATDRKKLPSPSAPPSGLTLTRVDYPEEVQVS